MAEAEDMPWGALLEASAILIIGIRWLDGFWMQIAFAPMLYVLHKHNLIPRVKRGWVKRVWQWCKDDPRWQNMPQWWPNALTPKQYRQERG